jgi:hypothetical protein
MTDKDIRRQLKTWGVADEIRSDDALLPAMTYRRRQRVTPCHCERHAPVRRCGSGACDKCYPASRRHRSLCARLALSWSGQ